MYDFHKKKTGKDVHTFFHQYFIKGKKGLISQIRRKNIKERPNKDHMEMNLSDYYKELSLKRLTKKSLTTLYIKINNTVFIH
jgi:hypothetical protein